MWNDLRFAARQLRKSPGFAVVAILTLALGIGVNTAIFSLLNAVLLRHLPVQRPAELVWLGSARANGSTVDLPDGATTLFSYSFFRDFRRGTTTLSDVAAVFSVLFGAHGRIAGGAGIEKMNVELVSGTYFSTLGLNPVQGRLFTEADDRTPSGHPVAVVSYSWWRRRFGMNPSAVGTTITIGNTAYSVVGVAPPSFDGLTLLQPPDLWIPLAMEKEVSPGWNGLENNMFQSLHIIARRKPGVSQQQAQAETNLLFHRIIRDYSGPQPSSAILAAIERGHVDLTPAATGRSPLRARLRVAFAVVMALVALVLLIACANVANLLLARATARQREIAVRMSMGAGRARLIRQLLAESVLLGLAGALTGVALAWGALRLLLAASQDASPGGVPLNVAPDLPVLGFTLAVTLLTVVLFGTAPAFFATSPDLASPLKESRSVTASRKRNLLSRVLVGSQIALSLMLVAGAGLFLRSLTNLTNIDTGFEKRNVLRMSFDPAGGGYKLDARLQSLMTEIEDRVSSLPGVQAASFALSVFDGGGWTDTVTVPGRPQGRELVHNVVGPRYLETMKMPIVSGRSFGSADTAASRKVAIINESMARQYFPGVSPLGRTFTVNGGIGTPEEWQNLEIVGVVKDAKYFTLDEPQSAAAFYPHAQHLPLFLNNLVVRYTGTPAAVVPEIRKAVADLAPDLPVDDVRTLAEHIDNAILDKRMVARLAAFFGALATVLACIGIYGLMSYAVARRTNEFGIRLALGARPGNVQQIVLRDVLTLAAAGVAAGLAGSLAAGRLVASFLYGMGPDDPVSIGSAAAAMILVALIAGYLPARRATHIDPMVALRHE